MTEKVILPQSEGKTLQDQDDAVLWQKFNIMLQAVAEVTDEYGSANDHPGVRNVTTGLRVIVQECARRKMFSWSVENREPNEHQLRTWYEVLKQLVEGDNQDKWEKVDDPDYDAEHEYRAVIQAMKDAGLELPAQVVGLQALDMMGTLTKNTPKGANSG